MGQSDFVKFLEREFYKSPANSFTKKEIEKRIGKGIKNYSIKSASEHGDITRELETIKTNKGLFRRFRYRYVPNGSYSITNFRNG